MSLARVSLVARQAIASPRNSLRTLAINRRCLCRRKRKPEGRAFRDYLYSQGNPVNLRDPSGQLSLAELQTAIVERARLIAQKLPNLKRAVKRVSETTGEFATKLGGLMIASLVVNPKNTALAALVFFNLRAPQVLYNTLRIGIDMLGGKDANFTIGIVTQKSLFVAPNGTPIDPYASYERTASEARQKLPPPSNRKYALFRLYPAFLYAGLGGVIRPPLPKDNNVAGEPSMAGIMIHEFAHATLDIAGDKAYGCQSLVLYNPLSGLASGVPSATSPNVQTPGDALRNPDSYRCFVRAASVVNLTGLAKLIT